MTKPLKSTIEVLLKSSARAEECPEVDRCQLFVSQLRNDGIVIHDLGDGAKLVRVGIKKQSAGCDYLVSVGLVGNLNEYVRLTHTLTLSGVTRVLETVFDINSGQEIDIGSFPSIPGSPEAPGYLPAIGGPGSIFENWWNYNFELPVVDYDFDSSITKNAGPCAYGDAVTLTEPINTYPPAAGYPQTYEIKKVWTCNASPASYYNHDLIVRYWQDAGNYNNWRQKTDRFEFIRVGVNGYEITDDVTNTFLAITTNSESIFENYDNLEYHSPDRIVSEGYVTTEQAMIVCYNGVSQRIIFRKSSKMTLAGPPPVVGVGTYHPIYGQKLEADIWDFAIAKGRNFICTVGGGVLDGIFSPFGFTLRGEVDVASVAAWTSDNQQILWRPVAPDNPPDFLTKFWFIWSNPTITQVKDLTVYPVNKLSIIEAIDKQLLEKQAGLQAVILELFNFVRIIYSAKTEGEQLSAFRTAPQVQIYKKKNG